MAKRSTAPSLQDDASGTKDGSIHFRTPARVREAAERAAAEDGRSLSGLALKIMTDWLREKGYLT